MMELVGHQFQIYPKSFSGNGFNLKVKTQLLMEEFLGGILQLFLNMMDHLGLVIPGLATGRYQELGNRNRNKCSCAVISGRNPGATAQLLKNTTNQQTQ